MCGELFDGKTFEVKLKDQISTISKDEHLEVNNELSVELHNEEETFNLSATLLGTFILSDHQGMSEKEIDYLIRTSTTTIIFPYLRSFITSLTALAGINPIILPIINIGKAMSEQRKDLE